MEQNQAAPLQDPSGVQPAPAEVEVGDTTWVDRNEATTNAYAEDAVPTIEQFFQGLRDAAAGNEAKIKLDKKYPEKARKAIDGLEKLAQEYAEPKQDQDVDPQAFHKAIEAKLEAFKPYVDVVALYGAGAPLALPRLAARSATVAAVLACSPVLGR